MDKKDSQPKMIKANKIGLPWYLELLGYDL